MKYLLYALLFFSTLASAFANPQIDSSADRAKTDLKLSYNRLGTLIQKDVSQTDNIITIGCETLDRDYADYHKYKDYLSKLGAKRIRLQGGWAKTEKVKGVYNFRWLDDIVNDALARGLIPWLQTSYGNPIYTGGGTPYLKGGMPSTPEAKKAWDNWVEAVAKRYAGKVEWEIWNEPDLNRKTPVSEVVDINIRTAEIIKKFDTKARISALSLARPYADRFIYLEKLFANPKAESLFEWVAFHDYKYRPESSYIAVGKLAKVLKGLSNKVILRQGENGAPSKGYLGGALSDYPWTELTQAKWNLRRMLGDHCRGFWTSCFSIADMHYSANDAIQLSNMKGLLETDKNHNVIKIKPSFYAFQHLVSVFNVLQNPADMEDLHIDTKHDVSLFGFKDSKGQLNSFVVWYDAAAPTNFNLTTPCDISFKNGKFKNPVWVDLLTGWVFEIPTENVQKHKDGVLLKGVPVYDSPILVTDKSLVDFK